MGEGARINRTVLGPGPESASFRVPERDYREALERAEDMLLDAQRMESVGRMAAAVAHDFNNTLSVILTYCDLLMTEPIEGGGGEGVAGDVMEIQKAAMRAARLSQRLVGFSRRRTPAPSPIDLSEVVLAIDGLIRKVAGPGVEVSLQLERPLPPVVADRLSLEQAILNLVTNAREAMAAPEGRKVLTIVTSALPSDDSDDRVGGPAVLLTITDTGPGMDDDTLTHCFDPFFTTKGSPDGAGLGLAMVQGVVRQSRGHVRVLSTAGKGTTVRIVLPQG